MGLIILVAQPVSIFRAKLSKVVVKGEIVMAVYYDHVTYAFDSESTLYSCLNAKELFAQNRHDI